MWWRWAVRMRTGRHEERLPRLRRRDRLGRNRGTGERVLEARTAGRAERAARVYVSVRQPSLEGGRLRVTVWGFDPALVEVYAAPDAGGGQYLVARYDTTGRIRPVAPETARTGAFPVVHIPEQDTGEHERVVVA